MTMVSLFFYNELMKLKRQAEPATNEVFFVTETEPKDREHYEDDGDWYDEDEYRE
jgi:hypothetical protein